MKYKLLLFMSGTTEPIISFEFDELFMALNRRDVLDWSSWVGKEEFDGFPERKIISGRMVEQPLYVGGIKHVFVTDTDSEKSPHKVISHQIHVYATLQPGPF